MLKIDFYVGGRKVFINFGGNLHPWKVSPRSRKADSVLEFPVGWGRATNTQLGDELVWEETVK